jgi:hypothetical protein
MRTQRRVRFGALVAGTALGGLALAGQAVGAEYGPVTTPPTPVTVNVQGFISIDGGGGSVGFGSVVPGGPMVESTPLAQVIKTNNATGYDFTANWTGFTGPTGAVPPVLNLKIVSGPSDADYVGPPASAYAPINVYHPVPVNASQIARLHRPTTTAGDSFVDQAAIAVDSGVTAGDYTGTLTFTAVSVP